MAMRFLYICAGSLLLGVTPLLSCSPSHSTAPSDLGSIIGETFVGTAAETLDTRPRTASIRFQFNYVDWNDQNPAVDIVGLWYDDSLNISGVVAEGYTTELGLGRYSTRFQLRLLTPPVGASDVLFGDGTFSGGYRRFEGSYLGKFHGDSIHARFVTSR